MREQPLTAIIADDHEIVRRGVKLMLQSVPDIDVIHESENGRDAMDAVRRLQPDLVILDLTMPEFSGVEVLGEILRRSPQTQTLIFTGSESNHRVLRALEMGAAAVVLKSSPPEVLLEAIARLRAGHKFIDAALADGDEHESPTQSLTRRELQILEGLLRGQTNGAIAARLHISPATVNNHRSNIMRKLNVHSAVELVSTVLQDDLVEFEL